MPGTAIFDARKPGVQCVDSSVGSYELCTLDSPDFRRVLDTYTSPEVRLYGKSSAKKGEEALLLVSTRGPPSGRPHLLAALLAWCWHPAHAKPRWGARLHDFFPPL